MQRQSKKKMLRGSNLNRNLKSPITTKNFLSHKKGSSSDVKGLNEELGMVTIHLQLVKQTGSKL